MNEMVAVILDGDNSKNFSTLDMLLGSDEHVEITMDSSNFRECNFKKLLCEKNELNYWDILCPDINSKKEVEFYIIGNVRFRNKS